jgi:hypothetical protein
LGEGGEVGAVHADRARPRDHGRQLSLQRWIDEAVALDPNQALRQFSGGLGNLNYLIDIGNAQNASRFGRSSSPHRLTMKSLAPLRCASHRLLEYLHPGLQQHV